MSIYSPSIEKLIEEFEKLPSIGHKTAQRLAFYMLDVSQEEAKEFTDAILNANVFPYLQEELYLNYTSYDLAKHSIVIGASRYRKN